MAKGGYQSRLIRGLRLRVLGLKNNLRLINLLENGEIPFHRVGTHCRIKHKNIIEFTLNGDNKKTIDMKSYEDKKPFK